MNMQHRARFASAASLALAILGGGGAAVAQVSPASTPAFQPGTESSAVYPLPDSHGGTLTVHAGMPAATQDYGPPPPFASLAGSNGRISQAEAKAYPPLDSDFLFASGGATSISRPQYQRWVESQFQ